MIQAGLGTSNFPWAIQKKTKVIQEFPEPVKAKPLTELTKKNLEWDSKMGLLTSK